MRELGFSDIDALHIALAEKVRADYFITCDDEIIKLYESHKDMIKVNIIGLIQFVSLEVK